MSKNTNTPASGMEKGTLYRIIAIAMAVLSVVALFLPFAKVLVGAFELQTTNLFGGLLVDGGKLLFLPIPATTSTIGTLAGLALYLVLAATIACLVLCIIAIIKVDEAKRLLGVALYVFTIAYAIYSISIVTVSGYLSMKITFDVYSLVLSVIGAIVYCVIALKAQGKAAWMQFLQFFLTLVVAALTFAFVALNGSKAIAGIAKMGALAYIIIGMFALTTINLFLGAARVQGMFKGLDRVRYIAELVLAVLACVVAMLGNMGNLALALALVAILVAAIQVGMSFIVKDSEEEEDEEDEEYEEEEYEEEDPLEDFRMEEYAEAYAYEGGPVDGVEMAEEVNPTFEEVDTPVNTAGYDFYNCQSFDPFIATLNTEERNQFTELFILKYRGVMPEIPDYVVGGDNREFFRKIFIYLGQYRERIPSGLLTKMYQFSVKLS